jgi:hypothetical protein
MVQLQQGRQSASKWRKAQSSPSSQARGAERMTPEEPGNRVLLDSTYN